MHPLSLDEPLVLDDPHTERMTDADFFRFCQQHPKLRIERNAQHQIILMAPTFSITGRRNARLTTQLGIWCEAHPELGEFFDSSAGFTLPSGAVRSPDVAWVPAADWNALTAEQQEKFAAVCPAFLVELKSQSDPLKMLLTKMEEYRENGTKLGWLLAPDGERAYIFRASETGYETVQGFDRELSGDKVLPGFNLDLRKLR